jgi:mutator protein MutT
MNTPNVAKGCSAVETNGLVVAPRREYPVIPLVGVGAVVVSDSNVLLVKRGHEPAKGLWSIPGGLIELGETAEAAVRREVKEETGVDVEIERLLDVVDNIVYDDQGKIRFHYVLVEFVARPVTTVARPSSDASDVKWVRFLDLSLYQMTKTARRFLDKLAMERRLAQK